MRKIQKLYKQQQSTTAMPTVYKNKGEKNLWSDEQLHAAMEAVSSGELKAHAAAEQYGIPSSTSHDHIKGKSTKRYGCAPTVLTAEEKEEIVTGAANPDHVLNSSVHATCSDCIVTNFKTSISIYNHTSPPPQQLNSSILSVCNAFQCLIITIAAPCHSIS